MDGLNAFCGFFVLWLLWLFKRTMNQPGCRSNSPHSPHRLAHTPWLFRQVIVRRASIFRCNHSFHQRTFVHTIRYEKISSISPCQTFFVLLRFFCFDSAVVDPLEGSMTRFFTITAWRDEASTLVDDGNGGDGVRGA
jgi:hypothetical protein